MKMSKNIVLLSITIVTLISLVAIATYSYFTASTRLTNKITTNVKMPLRPTFAVSGGGSLVLNVGKEDVVMGNSITYKTVNESLNVTLTGEPGTTCTYNVYYKDTSSNGSYVYTKTGSGTGSWDFPFKLFKNGDAVVGWNDYILLSQTSAGVSKITAMTGGSTAPFNQAKPIITIPNGSTSITDTWLFKIEFANQNWDQSALAGKTFKGELYIDDVVCT